MKVTHWVVSNDKETFSSEDLKLYGTTLAKIYSAVWLVKKNSRQLLSQSVAKCLFWQFLSFYFDFITTAFDTLVCSCWPLLWSSDTLRNALVCLWYLLHVVLNHLRNVNFPIFFKVRLCLRNTKKVLQRLDLIGNICDIVLSSFVI